MSAAELRYRYAAILVSIPLAGAIGVPLGIQSTDSPLVAVGIGAAVEAVVLGIGQAVVSLVRRRAGGQP